MDASPSPTSNQSLPSASSTTWHPSALECFTNHLRVSPPLVVQLALLRDVPEVQGIGVGLVRIRGTVAEHDDVSAGAKHLQEIGNDGDAWPTPTQPRARRSRVQAPSRGSHIPTPRQYANAISVGDDLRATSPPDRS